MRGGRLGVIMTSKKAQQSRKSDFVAQNWKQLSPKELEKLSLIERSRYFAYEPSPQAEKIKAAQQRVHQEVVMEKVEFHCAVYLT